jgi:hypothetical protein
LARVYRRRLGRVARKLGLPFQIRRWLGLSRHKKMVGRWEGRYRNAKQFAYGDDTTYKKGIAFLDGGGVIEDWGCGTAYAKNFVRKSEYVGIDGSRSDYVDKVVDLRSYTSEVDCVFMRHILEHNRAWRKILANAINSCKKRMVLILFTPFSAETQQIGRSLGVPDISFKKEEVTEFFEQFEYVEETLKTDTQYGVEHIFYIKK